MHKQWMGCSLSNFTAGRAGLVPQAIVLHSAGALAEIDRRCATTGTYNSLHYAIGFDGEIHQYVEERDTAYHAGLVVNPTWKALKPGKNPNLYTIGIACESVSTNEAPLEQYHSLAALLADVAARWSIALDTEHVVLHNEIRAGAGCPGPSFDRAKLLSLVPPLQENLLAKSDQPTEVTVLPNTNVREKPSLSARIARIARANSVETALGFTDQGQRINGNPCWHRTADGNYLWAGATDHPNPRMPAAVAPAQIRVAATPAAIGKSDIAYLDDLLTGSGGKTIGQGADAVAIGAIQDLLTGQGFPGLPTVLSGPYGTWNQKTTSALQVFQKQRNLPISTDVDRSVLRALIETPAIDARASRAYLSMVLQLPFSGLEKILSLVSQMEGAGKFGALNRNTDRAGLSFGLIQWAQRPGRLVDVLLAMSKADGERFVAIFGGGEPGVADALIAYCRRPNGGVNPGTGAATDGAFNLIEEPWLGRFRQAAALVPFQRAQVQAALDAFTKSRARVLQFAPNLVSERALGFMLDVANQFGDAGVENLYSITHHAGMRENEILEAMADETVARVSDQLKAGVRARRDRFLQTAFLSDQPVT